MFDPRDLPTIDLERLLSFDLTKVDLTKIDWSKVDLTKIDLSKIDWSKIDPTKIDWSAIDLPKIDLPKIDLPKVDLPKVQVPKVDVGGVELPEVDTDRLVGLARDAAYVSIGLGVLAVQQAQVRRRELQRSVERGVKQVRERVDALR